ncbi:MAG: hypothetical protein AABW47_05080 [Nanoarchaeota archaeon]
MSLSSLVIEYKWMLEVFYALAITAICMLIVLKTDKFYKLSLHQGIRYFRNAFFFFGIAFVGRYVFGIFSDLALHSAFIVGFFFEYFLIMAGFFLLYSLIWKKIESPNETYLTSLFNAKVMVFHGMALVLALLDKTLQTYYFMFFSQMLIFAYASVLSYKNYRKNVKHDFPKFYFVATMIGFVAWTINFLAASYFEWNHGLLIDVGLMNIMFFLLFLYGVVKVTKK